MKKFIMAIVCLMTMVGANAQREFNYLDYQKRIGMTDDLYNIPLTSYDNSNSFFEHFIIYGFGVGGGSINPTGKMAHSTFDMDMVFMNILFSIKLGSTEDTGAYSFDSTNSMQFGILIPVYGFGGEDWIGRKHRGKIYITPIFGWISGQGTYVDGHYLHDKVPSEQGGHICQYWVDTTTYKDQDCYEYGGGIMVKYGCGFLLGKFTDKGFGVSIGACF